MSLANILLNLSEQFRQKWKSSHYRLILMLVESPQNISEASQQNSVERENMKWLRTACLL